MKKFAVSLLLFFLSFYSQAQSEIVSFSYIEKVLKNTSDTTFIINFWATWCGPCVKELPEFHKMNDSIGVKKIKIILVSLDFKNNVRKLNSFVIKNKIKEKVVLLDDPKYNTWIDKVDQNWGGAIPATLIINNATKYRNFSESSVTFEQLNQ
ncbi:MAG: TlpA family protein disulfide reductase [Bacteroidetes bacterium]|nr:MAG: TlpA family protein disulfide reductase [Bacteroidota bacterium]